MSASLSSCRTARAGPDNLEFQRCHEKVISDLQLAADEQPMTEHNLLRLLPEFALRADYTEVRQEQETVVDAS